MKSEQKGREETGIKTQTEAFLKLHMKKKEPAVHEAPTITENPLRITGPAISIAQLLELSRITGGSDVRFSREPDREGDQLAVGQTAAPE